MAVHVVTGAGSGIGAEIAVLLRERGDELVLLARSAERAEEMGADFPAATFIVADLAHPHTIKESIEKAALPQHISSVIHAAGVVDLGLISEATVQSWQTQMNVNVIAPAALTSLLLPQLRQSQGDVVFVNSGAGLRANAHWGAYAASKHALKVLADALRDEEAKAGIRVTSVYPGRTATPMQELVHEQEDRAYDSTMFIDPCTVANTVLAAIDLPRDAHLVDVSIRPVTRSQV